jgi:nucleotide-binding universal stress UspA family protein
VQHRWKVLAPIDLASNPETRVQHAISVAEAVHGDLTLLYVVDDRRSRPTEPVEWPAHAIAERARSSIRRVVLFGSVAETAARYADDIGADLLSVTSAPSGIGKRLWKSSIADHIGVCTDRPVCVSQISAGPPPSDFRSILCVVALDGTDDPIVSVGAELAQRSDATIVLLHVIPEVSEGLLAYGIPGTDDRPLSREVAEHRLRELTAGLSRPHLGSIASGSTYRGIAHAARKHNVDLIITGRRTAGSTARLDQRSVLARVSCPVISVPAGSRALVHSTIFQEPVRARDAC